MESYVVNNEHDWSLACRAATLVLSLILLGASWNLFIAEPNRMPYVIDVGEVTFDSATTQSIQLHNDTDEEFSILSINDCCSFSEVTPLPITVAPGETLPFEVYCRFNWCHASYEGNFGGLVRVRDSGSRGAGDSMSRRGE